LIVWDGKEQLMHLKASVRYNELYAVSRESLEKNNNNKYDGKD
jgi:hypothetical protein